LNNVRIRFVRGEEVKYISHLDLMKVFERALRRGGLPIAYSQGFNPHPHMVFGLPMSVGVTSEAEYADIELTGEMAPDEFAEKFNTVLPAGFKILEARNRVGKDNIMASIAEASYEILVCAPENVEEKDLSSTIVHHVSQNVLMVKKEGKNGVKDVNIRPMIRKLSVVGINMGESGQMAGIGQNDPFPKLNGFTADYIEKLRSLGVTYLGCSSERVFCLSASLSAGSVANLKPDLLVQALNEADNLSLKIMKIHRTGLFIQKEGKMMDPLDPAAL
jgi:radical SAM-linked protein